MATLTRTVRFAINPPACRRPAGSHESSEAALIPNGYAGSPALRGLGRHYALEVTCRGQINPSTGYLINIKDIDRAVRRGALPVITRACDERPETDPGTLLPILVDALSRELPQLLHAVRWWLSPYYSVEMSRREPQLVLLRQRFDLAASHRLHVSSMSEAQNQALFGKCNNPSGHGHNYQFEPTVAIRLRENGPAQPSFTLDDLERIADQVIVRRFDHKNLNCDTAEFAPSTGVNPSVEQIARIFYELLGPAISQVSADAQLRSLTVWETDRTSSTYPGE